VLVETGTFQGDTVAEVATLFDEIHTVELSEELYQQAQARFADQQHIHVYQGDSPQFLSEIRGRFSGQGVLYWLDAHWCVAEGTAGQISQCPLLQELAALGQIDTQTTLLIDDARLYLCPPPDPHEVSQWPSWQEIITALQQLSSQHETMVVNDVIAYYPAAAREAMQRYSRNYSVDWLAMIHRVRQYEQLDQQCARQREVIEQLRQRVQQQAGTIRQQQADLRELRGHGH
jgi:hypothetical protein